MLRSKRVLVFLAIGFATIPAYCAPQSATPPASVAQRESLSVADAMKLLYGNYDFKTGYSIFLLPEVKESSVPLQKNEPMVVSPLYKSFFIESGVAEFGLVTYAVPRDRDFYCHSCAPLIGMAVFSRSGKGWIVTAANRAITNAGSFAKPPAGIHSVQIGLGHTGIEIRDTDRGGQNTSVLLMLVAWKGTVNLALERIVSDDNAGMCGELACYSNRRAVTFQHQIKDGYFPLKLTLSGTDLDGHSNKLRHVQGVEILQFKNGGYVQLSRTGDLTDLDRAVAEREGLK